VLAPLARLAGSGRLGTPPPGTARPPGGSRPDRLAPGQPGQRQHPGQKGGEQTGPNPTDKGKPGSKRHLIVDGGGIPLAILLGPANRHDSIPFEALLDAVRPIKRPRGRPRKRPAKLHADKAYDIPRCRRALSQRHIKVRIARKGIESSERLGRHRWVVERTLAWLARFRRLTIRYERRADIHEAFLHLGCALICLNYLS
jgi:transposase